MIRNLGRVATILARAEAREIDGHASISAFGAPGECHRDFSKGEARRMRVARRHAEALARRPYRTILKELMKRGYPVGSPKWDRFVGRFVNPYL